jgi:hypothetical protein
MSQVHQCVVGEDFAVCHLTVLLFVLHLRAPLLAVLPTISVEQMPTVSRSDCTEIDLTETFKFTYDATAGAFDAKMTNIDINFNACKGINNRNNDLWVSTNWDIARCYEISKPLML